MSPYRQSVAYTCSACSHQGTVDTWLVVDVTERPDLTQVCRIRPDLAAFFGCRYTVGTLGTLSAICT